VVDLKGGQVEDREKNEGRPEELERQDVRVDEEPDVEAHRADVRRADVRQAEGNDEEPDFEAHRADVKRADVKRADVRRADVRRADVKRDDDGTTEIR
jgi:hypothetical protein